MRQKRVLSEPFFATVEKNNMRILVDKKIKILIVDDEADARKLLVDLLSRKEVEVKSAKDGSEAIARIEKEDFNIIITDLMMPKVNGIQVLKASKRHNPDTLVIIITGYGSLDSAMEAIKMGAYDYITKPFKLEEMETVVKNAGEKVSLLRENKNLIEELKDTYLEMEKLSNSQKGLHESLEKINQKMGENQTKITKGLTSLQTLPENLLPFQYQQRRREDKGYLLIELEKLGQLKKEKILNDDEFEICKSKIMSKI